MNGQLYFSNMKWFIKKTLDFIENQPGMATSIYTYLGKFTPFAVASYGRNIDNIVALVDEEEGLPEPSMIEGPFLWTLGILGLIDVVEETVKTETRTEGILIFARTVTETVPVLEKVKDLDKLYYYRGNQ